MDLRFKGSLSKEEYPAIITLINSPTKENPYPRPRVNRLPLILLLLMSVVMIIALASYGTLRQDLASLLMIIAPALLVCIIMLNLLGKGRPSPAAQAEAIWKTEANRTLVLEGAITDDGVLMKAPAGESLTRWNAIFGYGEYKDILVLALYNDTFLSFSKRFFEQESDWDAFHTRVAGSMDVIYRVVELGTSQRSES